MPGTWTNRYWVLRHGHSQANEAGLIVSDPQNAVTRYGLTDKGRSQVREGLAQARAEGVLDGGAVVYCSPLLRAVQTAEIVAEVLGVPGSSADDRLRERSFGELELTCDGNYERVWAEDARDPDHTLWAVEAVRAVLARSMSLIVQIERSMTGRTILLVTHGDVASILSCAAAGVDLRRHRLYAFQPAQLCRMRSIGPC